MLPQSSWSGYSGRRLDRRRVLRTGIAAGGGLAAAMLAACGGGGSGKGSAASGGGGARPQAGGVTKAELIPANTKQPKPGGTFRWPVTDTHRVHDPEVSIGTSIWNWIGDRALSVNPRTLELQPEIVESWQQPDPATIIFKVRQNVHTHDKPPSNGRLLDAEDVAYNIQRKAARLDPQSRGKYPRANQYDNIDRIEAPDKSTIKITMKAPDSTVLSAFADIRAQIAPRDFTEKVGFEDPLKAVATGPWVITEYALGDHETFKKHPKYWRQGMPAFDTAEVRVIADRASTLAGFISGEIHLFPGWLPHEKTAIEGQRRETLFYAFPGPTWDHFRFNLKRSPFQDYRVRRAIHLAMDYKTLGDSAGVGWAYTGPLHSGFPEAWKPEKIASLPGYNPQTKQQDIAEAVKLMEAAGFPKGAGLSFKSAISGNSGRTFENGVRIKDQFAKIWPQLTMELAPYQDYSSYTKLHYDKAFETTCYNHTTVPEAVLELRTYFHSTGGRNYSSFSDPMADALLDKALAELDNTKRAQLLDEFQDRYFKEWLPLIDIYVPGQRDAVPANFGGYDKTAGTWGYHLYGSLTYAWYFTT